MHKRRGGNGQHQQYRGQYEVRLGEEQHGELGAVQGVNDPRSDLEGRQEAGDPRSASQSIASYVKEAMV